ncbi:hypothetical protein Moror_6665 [Moniliophthora roreri MCA 2997]|uniref:Uncharacterized protein n=1 Tax=Moniliophthora roreri (strain MCA 2997) TaxID=1381753 RepID=V2XC81_MONRO|nr:hypothetical protein Moror_6665 [Moniliophthora roreri MCA 2997]
MAPATLLVWKAESHPPNDNCLPSTPQEPNMDDEESNNTLPMFSHLPYMPPNPPYWWGRKYWDDRTPSPSPNAPNLSSSTQTCHHSALLAHINQSSTISQATDVNSSLLPSSPPCWSSECEDLDHSVDERSEGNRSLLVEEGQDNALLKAKVSAQLQHDDYLEKVCSWWDTVCEHHIIDLEVEAMKALEKINLKKKRVQDPVYSKQYYWKNAPVLRQKAKDRMAMKQQHTRSDPIEQERMRQQHCFYQKRYKAKLTASKRNLIARSSRNRYSQRQLQKNGNVVMQQESLSRHQQQAAERQQRMDARSNQQCCLG